MNMNAPSHVSSSTLLGVMASESDRPHESRSHAMRRSKAVGLHLYLTVSDLLEAVEMCPQCREYWDEKSGGSVQSALDQWNKEGRPVVEWPETSPHLAAARRAAAQTSLPSHQSHQPSSLDHSYFRDALTPNDPSSATRDEKK